MRKILCLAACAAALSGCTGVPSARYFPQAEQQVVGSAAHWQAIAGDVVARIRPSLGSTVRVVPPQGRSVFEHAFAGMLDTALVDRGVAVLHRGAGVERVRFEVEVVDHDRLSVPHPGSLTLLGTLAGGLGWAATTSSTVAPAAAPGIGAGVGLAGEIARGALPASPSEEIVVTTVLSRSGADVLRLSQVYYVADGDAHLYEQPGQRKEMLGNFPDYARDLN